MRVGDGAHRGGLFCLRNKAFYVNRMPLGGEAPAEHSYSLLGKCVGRGAKSVLMPLYCNGLRHAVSDSVLNELLGSR